MIYLEVEVGVDVRAELRFFDKLDLDLDLDLEMSLKLQLMRFKSVVDSVAYFEAARPESSGLSKL